MLTFGIVLDVNNYNSISTIYNSIVSIRRINLLITENIIQSTLNNSAFSFIFFMHFLGYNFFNCVHLIPLIASLLIPLPGE